MSGDRPHVAVVGGGLAGITAALDLVDSGARVSLFESRPRLGGATWSFERNGLHFDNGQHVYLRCCGAYRRLLERLGSTEKAPLQERLEIPVLSPRDGGEPVCSVIRRVPLPTPFHLAPSLATYRHLALADRLRLGSALRALLAASLDDPALDEETFASFLGRNGQSDAAISRLWDLITLPTTNLRSEEVSAAVALKVFRTGLLDEADAADIGWSRVPLSELHGSPAHAELDRAGATVALRAKVEGFELDDRSGEGERVTALRVGGERIEVDGVVLAVPHTHVAELAPPGARLDTKKIDALGASPIIDVHVVYEEAVTDLSIAAALDSPVQYVFDRSSAAGLEPGKGQCLAVSISGADDEHGERPEVLIERYTTALAELFPRARSTKVLDAVVSREHHATFRARPGQADLRPGPVTEIPNLVLAGSWTDTGWPATMEGAVRSGTQAVWHLRRALGERARAPNSCGGGAAMSSAPVVPDVLGCVRSVVAPALRRAIDTLSDEIRPVAAYHLGWTDSLGRAVDSDGGKGIRPALAVLSAEVVGARAETGVPGAVAVELVHNFSLVHDDVIDGDEERRHRQTVWSLFGVGRAIVAGDALLTLAQQVVLDPELALGSEIDFDISNCNRAARHLADATAAMNAGQALDMDFEQRRVVSYDSCLEMEAGKTGALLACAASIGAVLAGADEPQVGALWRFGMELGLSFQAVDDLLGVWGDPETTGKPTFSDLRQHKKTLPVAAAIAAGGAGAEELISLLSTERLSEGEVVRAAELVESLGGRQEATDQAHRSMEAALAALDDAASNPAARAELVDLASFVVERQF